ncbi:oligosaccharide flippase family protein [Bosea sp. PAMC 26642]|uniref:oligosaccharide flippase family protein n=1 Tax=Bosea sp. (strain PAMC 26642) TaxID=1792307 RepID=UPI0007701CDD|nr:oligosaccharide flippase family protein [Bosea sp. PAMC 26642]AMJ62537.1 hypothetical protein AXW83_21505 [Bosea sp. PAMC 26642]
MLGANVVEVLLPLMRNVALARILPQEQFGFAVTLQVTLAIGDMMTDLGLPQTAYRGGTGKRYKSFLQTVHAINMIKALLVAVIMPLAVYTQFSMLSFEHNYQTYLLVILIIFIRSFENLSVKRLLRLYKYGVEATIIISTQIVLTASTIALAFYLRDYSCVLWGSLVSVIWTTLLSQVMAPARWRLGFDRAASAEVLRFGLPLVPNGIASSMSVLDRLVVGATLGAVAVAHYSVIMSIIQLPRTVLWRISTTSIAAHFTNLNVRGSGLVEAYRVWAVLISLVAYAYAIAIVAAGPTAIAIIFGAAYEPSRVLICIAAINVTVKIMMLIPIPSAYSTGRTKLVSLGSVVATLALIPASLTLMTMPGTVELFLGILTLVEAIGAGTFLFYCARRFHVGGRFTVLVLFTPLAALSAILISTHWIGALDLLPWMLAVISMGAVFGALQVLILCRFAPSALRVDQFLRKLM